MVLRQPIYSLDFFSQHDRKQRYRCTFQAFAQATKSYLGRYPIGK